MRPPGSHPGRGDFHDRRDVLVGWPAGRGDRCGVGGAGRLDDLAGTGTVRVDAGELTVLLVFADSREHLMEASRNMLLVPVGRAKSVADFTGMVADAARVAGPGTWVLAAMTWHESNLAENAGPTRPGCRRLSPPRRHPAAQHHLSPQLTGGRAG